jgi:hypothetical protein
MHSISLELHWSETQNYNRGEVHLHSELQSRLDSFILRIKVAVRFIYPQTYDRGEAHLSSDLQSREVHLSSDL